MKNFISINGQKTELTEEQVQQIKAGFGMSVKLADVAVGDTVKIGDETVGRIPLTDTADWIDAELALDVTNPSAPLYFVYEGEGMVGEMTIFSSPSSHLSDHVSVRRAEKAASLSINSPYPSCE